ncbi:aromatic ring-hydroxylating oxygenase subunit alpha [Xenophilus azovorans]|uniref:aromatic ring-hydroxylating oxygenase subunit alpha n=1 Tax=Xenophilus azovorans TaxID=151755 RepID=UPI00068D59A5|nr:Rieske 2Fe-2S domain-containing protein [Xenophilus azovorans]
MIPVLESRTLRASPPLDYASLVHADRVHGSLYSLPQVFDDEMDAIFHKGWVYVGHESEIPKPGDYVSRRMGKQSMILTRGADQEIALLYDRCPHRGNKICPADHGSVQSFVCVYHGWAFKPNGEFLMMPAPEGFPEGCDKAALSMARAPRLESYGGFVFASLAPQGISLDRHLGRGKTMIDMLNGLSPEGRVRLDAGWMKHRLHGNWKGLVENHVDGYHPQIVHGSLLRANKPFAGVRDRKDTSASRVRDLGNGHAELDFAADFRQRNVMLGWTGGVSTERLPNYVDAMRQAYGEAEANRRLIDGPPHAAIFPNLLLAEMNIMFIEPLSEKETLQQTTAVMMEGGAELNPRTLRRCEGALGPAGFLISDDAEITDIVQQGVSNTLPEWLLLKRGMHDEVVEEGGTRAGGLKDETTQRAFWSHYKNVMA